MKVILILGCWGREHYGFKFCNGVENIILDITKKTERNMEISNFIDSHYKIFDKPLYTNIHTALFNIQQKFSIKGTPVFEEKIFKTIEEFCITHRKCGLYLRLDLNEV